MTQICISADLLSELHTVFTMVSWILNVASKLNVPKIKYDHTHHPLPHRRNKPGPVSCSLLVNGMPTLQRYNRESGLTLYPASLLCPVHHQLFQFCLLLFLKSNHFLLSHHRCNIPSFHNSSFNPSPLASLTSTHSCPLSNLLTLDPK